MSIILFNISILPLTISQVPEDILFVLENPTIFEGSADLTTKEILKRIAEIDKRPQPTSPAMVSPGGRTHTQQRPSQGRNVGSVVSQDPQAWHNETTVRHVGGAGAGPGPGPNNFNYGPSQHGMSTPPVQYPPGATASPGRQDQFRSDFRGQQGPMGIGAG
jgi:hypothetical protein